MKQPPPPPQTISAAIYCRVSTYEQGKGDFSSLDSQEQMLRQYCEAKGYVVYDVYRDTESGTTLEREFLQHLLVDATARKFNVLVVTKFDRISRNVKDFLDLDETLNKLGIDIIVTTQNLDTTNPQGKMMRTILVAFAQFERDMIAERTREKLYNQAKSGYWGGGHVPLGYDVVDKKLVVNKTEAALVKRIFAEYLITPSSFKIARWLNDNGYRTKIRNSKRGNATGGGEFRQKTVHDILRNKIYIGRVTYQGEQFEGLHEGILTSDLFEKVQQRIDQSSVDRYATYEDSPLLLLGLTICGLCDSQMTTSFSQKKATGERHYYYQCTTVQKYGRDKCESKSLPARDLERFTEQLLVHTATDDGFFEAVVRQVKGNANETLATKKNLRTDLSLNQASVKKQVNTIVNNLTMLELKPEEMFEMKAKIGALKSQESRLDQELQSLDREIQRVEGQQFDKKVLRSIFQDFAAIYSGATPESKRRLLNVIVEEIRCMVKKREKKGDIIFKLRGNGSVKREWEEAKKQEDPKPPSSGGSSLQVAWLREQDSNLQPCGYGLFQSFRFGPDYLIILRLVPLRETCQGCRALLGLIGENPHPLVSARSPLLASLFAGLRSGLPCPQQIGVRLP